MKTINHVSRQNNAGRTLLSLFVFECETCWEYEVLQPRSCFAARSAIQETRMKCLLCTLIRFILYMWELLHFV
jgi:hypothetical protein